MVFISLVVTLEHVSDASRVSWSIFMACKQSCFVHDVPCRCQVSVSSVVEESASHPLSLCKRECPKFPIRTGSLAPRSNFGTCRGQKMSFLKSSHVNISDGLHITCGDSRTCFRCLTGVLVKFHDIQEILILHDFRVGVKCQMSIIK